MTIPAYIIVPDQNITLVYPDKGTPITIDVSDKRYDRIIDLIEDQEWDRLHKLVDKRILLESAIELINTDTINLYIDEQGQLYYNGQVCNSLVATRIYEQASANRSVINLKNFVTKLYNNQSMKVVDQLYGFLESTKMPIVQNGNFLAYKVISDDYKDLYTGKIDNSVGQVVTMPRNQVMDDPTVTCSFGLHFCGYKYVRAYASSTTRLMVVEVDPMDVVSIPIDYNQQKGRACKYKVVSEIAKTEYIEDWEESVHDVANDMDADDDGFSYEED